MPSTYSSILPLAKTPARCVHFPRRTAVGPDSELPPTQNVGNPAASSDNAYPLLPLRLVTTARSSIERG